MGSNLPQGRHQLQEWPPQPGMVRPLEQIGRAQAALQSPLLVLPQPHHGRGPQHDPALPVTHPLQVAAGERELRAEVSQDDG